MDIGVFIRSEQRLAVFHQLAAIHADLRSQQADRPEGRHYGLDFALSMIKLRGFGGKRRVLGSQSRILHPDAGTGRREQAHSSFYASVAVLTIPPPIVARMAST